jgi:hypothetical protein
MERARRNGFSTDDSGIAGALTIVAGIRPTCVAVLALLATADAWAADTPEAAVPSTTATLTPARSRLLLGTDKEVTVNLEVTGAEAQVFNPLRVFATVGTLDMPLPTGAPGRFVARYLAPGDRFPQVALLVVELGSGLRRIHAAARIALDGSTVVPFHTSAGTSVTMRVAGKPYGPVVADRQGRVEIPIQVPPGVRSGVARAVDHAGAARETEVDLQLAPFPRMVLLAPTALDAGSFAELVVLSVEPDGTPTPAGQLTLGASAGLLHPLGAGPSGEARFLFEAPRRVGSGALALTATSSSAAPTRADLAVPLRAGATARLVMSPSNNRLIVGEPDIVRIAIAAQDAFGNPTSALGVTVKVEGVPRFASIAPDGTASVTVTAPGRFDGRERITVEAALGNLRATEAIRVTGGVPARLTLAVRDARLVADGKQGTELRALAIDRNGTPTAVPGLSWDTPEGRVRRVRVPRDGEYIAEYVPDRTREAERQTVAVMASQTLRANATLDVTPPPVRLVAAVRAGLFYNLGQAAGPVAFVEALRPMRVRRIPFLLGVSAGYLRGDVTSSASGAAGTARLETDQVPLLAVARARMPLALRFEVAAEVLAGASFARSRITASLPDGASFEARGTARAPAFGLGGELALTLRPGRLVIGLRYLWIQLGRTSQGDVVDGNSAGLIGDLGYRMTF